MSELTKQALRVENNQSFPNNNAGLITPSALRTFNENMIDSNVNQDVYDTDSASFDSRIDALSGSVAVDTGSLLTTASFDNNTRNLTFTKGNSSTFSVNIPDASGSVLPSGVVSGSSQITNLGFVSASVTGSSLITASLSGNTITFTKGDSSTFGFTIPDVSGSVLPSGVVSGSSQVSYPLLSNIPAGIVSGSSQLTGSFVTTDTIQVITGRKSFSPSPDGSIGIAMQNATRLSFGSVGTNRISSPDSNRLDIETINGAPVVGSPNTINVISGVSGSTFGDGSIINIETRGLQVGQSVNVRTPDFRVTGRTGLSGSLNVSGSVSHALTQGSVLVGDSSGRTQAIPTSSFGGGGTGNGFPFSGSAVITGSLEVSETITSQVYINPQVLDGFTIPTGNNAMLVGPVSVSGSIVVEGNSNLIVLSQVTGSGGGGTIDTSSLATTGSNTFIGNQTITGSLFLSSSDSVGVRIVGSKVGGIPTPDSGVVLDSNLVVIGDTRFNGAFRAFTAGVTNIFSLGVGATPSSDGNLYIDTTAPNGGSGSLFIKSPTTSITGSLRVSSSVDRVVIEAPGFSNFNPNDLGGVIVSGSFSVVGDTRLGGAVRFSQLDVTKIVNGQGGLIPQLAIVSNTLFYNDSNINIPIALGVSGSVFVSQSIHVGEAVRLSPSDPLPITGSIGALAVSGSSLYFYDGTWRQVSLV